MASGQIVERWLKAAGAERIRVGDTEITCTCPFHSGRSKGVNFSFNFVKGVYVCYVPSCGASGTAELFLQRALGYSKIKAKEVAYKQSFEEELTLDEVQLLDPERVRAHAIKARPDAITEGELGMFDFCPKYMLKRGYTKETLKRWEIGYDAETKRVTFPVRTKDGLLLGVSCRTVIKDLEPKYLHLGFDKGDVLYGSHLCKNIGGVVVVEGQTDTLAIDQRARNMLKRMNLGVVGVLGANVTDNQVAMLARFGRVILAFDNDQAGQDAISSVGTRLTEKISPSHVHVAHRFTTHDPGDLISASDYEMEQFFDTTPFVEFNVSLLGKHNARNETRKAGSRQPQRPEESAVFAEVKARFERVRPGHLPGHRKNRTVLQRRALDQKK